LKYERKVPCKTQRRRSGELERKQQGLDEGKGKCSCVWANGEKERCSARVRQKPGVRELEIAEKRRSERVKIQEIS